jgi:hypothetical protein
VRTERSQDPLALDIALAVQKRFSELGFETVVDADDVEPTLVAKVRAAGQDEAARVSLIDDYCKDVRRQIIQMIEDREAAAAQPQDWRDPAALRKKRAAAISREIAARADELKRRGVRNPVTQAEKEIAEHYQHASGAALNRWLRRHR